MKVIKIKELTISNWRGMNTKVVFGENETLIEGRNKSGKSSIISAWTWLLTSYCDASTPKNYNLFDNKKEVSIDTPIASVRAIITIDGLEYSIERRAKAKFTRDRGTNEYSKSSSDEYTILVDDVTMSVSNFEEFVLNTMGVDVRLLPYCLNGRFFTTLTLEDKNEARNALLSLVGEIKEEDYEGDYEILRDKMAKGYSLEQIEEQAKNRVKKINEALISIPSAIEAKENLLANSFEIFDFEALEKELSEEKVKLSDIEERLLDSTKELSEIVAKNKVIYDKISSLEMLKRAKTQALIDGKKSIEEEYQRRVAERESMNNLIRIENNREERRRTSLELEIISLNKELDVKKSRKESLGDKLLAIKSRVFKEECCALCGSPLPTSMLETLRSTFDEKNRAEYKETIEEGKALKEAIENLEKKIEECENDISSIRMSPLHSTEDLIEDMHIALDSYPKIEDNEEILSIDKDIDELKKSILSVGTTNNTILLDEKRVLLERIEDLNRKIGLKEVKENLKREIATLKDELKSLGVELALCERILIKVKERREDVANIISRRVNKHLTSSRIEMFSSKRDGTLIPNCVIRDKDGVLYATLNNSARMLVDLEMQALYTKMNELVVPIFVDECSIYDSMNLPKFDTQAIYMKASDDNYLKITTK